MVLSYWFDLEEWSQNKHFFYLDLLKQVDLSPDKDHQSNVNTNATGESADRNHIKVKTVHKLKSDEKNSDISTSGKNGEHSLME
jgi:hypothetical protein